MALPTFSFGLDTGDLAIELGDRGIIGEIFSAELTEPSSGLIRLPGWMRIKCDTVARSAQQTASTVMSGYAAHSARAYSQDGLTYGLLVEHAGRNMIAEHDLNNWTPSGTPLLNSIVGPDGTTGDYEVEDDDGAAAENLNLALSPLGAQVVLDHTMSFWHLNTEAESARFLIEDSTEDPVIIISTVDADWTRSDVTVTEFDEANAIAFVSPRIIAVDVGACGYFGLQVELGSYPTQFHPAASFTDAREADTLQAVTAAIIPDGYQRFDMVYRPHYAHDETSSDHNLLYIDDDNRVYFRNSDANIVFVSGGDELASGALTFDRHDTITLFWENSPNRRLLTVSGVLTGAGTVSGTVQPALDPALTATFSGILGASGAEEAADLLSLDPNVQTFPELADCRALAQMDDIAGNRDFRDLLRVFAEQPGRFFDVCTGLKAALELDTACGAQLDLIGGVVGLPREGFTDDRYRTFLEIQTELLLASERDDAEWTGTGENLLRIARKFVGPLAGTITLNNFPPYLYQLDVPGLDFTEGALLARFLTTATYAGVLGVIVVALGDPFDSDSVAITDPAKFDSDSVAITGPGQFSTVLTTT